MMKAINIHLYFAGTCEEAFTFYKTIFNSEVSFVIRHEFQNLQSMGAADLPELYNGLQTGKVMYLAMPLSDHVYLLGTDTLYKKFERTPGKNTTIDLQAGSEEEVSDLFNKLVQDGEVIIPISTTSWGVYGVVDDQFGIRWEVTCRYY